MGAIIWQKVTTCHTTGGATVMGSYPYPRNGILKLDYEFILIFKKYGNPPKVSYQMKEKSKLTDEEWNQYFTGHWNFPGEKQDKHLAMFPEELPKRLIKMFSFVGDTVLDPFLGSGTTTLAAKNLDRNSIGYEINPQFLSFIKEKIRVTESAQGVKFEFIKQETMTNDWKSKIQNLPYQFHDPVKFDKKIDPKKLKFGSKIDFSESSREKFYSVREIINPELIVLNNGLRIKLLGVKLKMETIQMALDFLHTKLKNQRVFLRFDNQKHDDNGNLLCYLYLKNKTFINAHLLKNKLVDVDTDLDFRYKDKFINLLQ